MSTPNAELVGFLNGILWPTPGNLDGCGALADWLVEHEDARGVLLKRRWQRWRKEREKAVADLERMKAVILQPWQQLIKLARSIPGASCRYSIECPVENAAIQWADTSFRKYLQEKFPQEWQAAWRLPDTRP